MNIASTIGIKEMRSSLIASFTETEDQGPPFSESLGKSLADVALKTSEEKSPQKKVGSWQPVLISSQNEVSSEETEGLLPKEVQKEVPVEQNEATLPAMQPEDTALEIASNTIATVNAAKDAKGGSPVPVAQANATLLQGKMEAKSLSEVLEKLVMSGKMIDASGQQVEPVGHLQIASSPHLDGDEKSTSAIGVEGEKTDGAVKEGGSANPIQEITDAKAPVPVAKLDQKTPRVVSGSREKDVLRKVEASSLEKKAEPRKVAKDIAAVQDASPATVAQGELNTASVQASGEVGIYIPNTVTDKDVDAMVKSSLKTGRESLSIKGVGGSGTVSRSGKSEASKEVSLSDATQATKLDEHQAGAPVLDAGKEESAPVHSVSTNPAVNHSVQTSPMSTVHDAVVVPLHTAESATSFGNAVGVNLHAAKTQGSAEAFAQPYETTEQRTIVATPNSIEVGVPGGTHGWLKVRAELAGDGGVHASVSAGSASGTEMLRRELPTLTSFLHQEQISVNSVAVHASPGSDGLADMSGGGAGHNREMGQQGMSDAQNGSRQQGAMDMRRTEEGVLVGAVEEDGGEEWLPATGYEGAGGWLSVRA